PALAESGAKDLFASQLNHPGQVTNYGLKYWIELVRNRRSMKVDSQYLFQSGDRIRFHITTNIDGYMYIFMTAGSSGKQAVLFPPQGKEADNRVVAGKEYVLPQDSMLEFDQHPGVESVELVLSDKGLRESDSKGAKSIIIRAKEDDPGTDAASSVRKEADERV